MEKAKTINLGTLAKKYGTVAAFIVICIFFSLSTDVFLTRSNILTVLRQISMLAILGGGLTVVMITGRIDLSIGYGTSLLGIFCAALMVDFGISMPVAVLLTLLGGALIGLLNGTLIAYGGVPDFICTLGTGFLLSGINQAYTEGHPISGLPDSFDAFGNMSFLGIPTMIFILAFWLLIIAVVLSKTRFGRHTYVLQTEGEIEILKNISQNKKED